MGTLDPRSPPLLPSTSPAIFTSKSWKNAPPSSRASQPNMFGHITPTAEPTISALSIMLVRLLFWDSLAGSISRSLCPVMTLITPQSFQPVILTPNSLLGTNKHIPLHYLSWWFFELPVHGGRCSLVALWGWYLPLKTDQIVPMVYVKKWPETTDLLFLGLRGGLRLITKSLLMGASVHRLALLNALATPWHKALVSGPSGTGATSTTSATSAWDTPRVWWVDLRVGLGSVFFFTKKTWEKRAKILGKKRVKQISGFFWWKETKSFVKNNAWIIHTSCNEDYSKIHVENNFEVEYQLFIDFFTSH